MKFCWFYQKWITRSVAMEWPLPHHIKKHLATCPACQQVYQDQLWLTRQLVTTAVDQHKTPSPFLHARIMASIDQARSSSQQPVNWFKRLLHLCRGVSSKRRTFTQSPNWAARILRVGVSAQAVAILVVVLLAAVVILHEYRSPDSQTPLITETETPLLLQDLAERITETDGAKLLEWSQSLEQPLDKEMQHLVSDAKLALGALARNFLPPNVLAESASKTSHP